MATKEDTSSRVASKRQKRVIIADDEFYIRALIASWMREAGHVVVGEAHDGDEALTMTRRLAPDLLLLDISMPRVTGLDILPELAASCPATQVIMLTSLADEETVDACIEQGAAGFIRKDSSSEEVQAMVSEVFAGS